MKPLLIMLLLVTLQCGGSQFGTRENVLTPGPGEEVRIMDFSSPPSLDPIEPGWHHRRFFWHGPMQIEFVNKDQIPAVRITTSDTASMLFRHVDIPLERYPFLAWKWYVEDPIETELDERTREGDDHPARFFLEFETVTREKRHMEIIWGNRLRAGEFLRIGNFPHYVARGGQDRTGRWFDESLDLRKILKEIWPHQEPLRLTEIALFCDSDETGEKTAAYFADVRLKKQP